MGECLAGTALYRSWIVYHHIIMHIFNLAKQVAYFKALGRDTSIFSQRERTCGNKRRKMSFYNLNRRWNLSINVRDRSFVISIIVLKIWFSCLHFFTFCYLSWATVCDVAFSDYYESILFHVGSSTFEISTKLAVIVAQ